MCLDEKKLRERKGRDLEEVLEQMGMVVEGVRTAEAAYQFAKEQNIDMPITTGIYDIVNHNKKPKEVVEQLMNRDKREEMDDLASLLKNRYAR